MTSAHLQVINAVHQGMVKSIQLALDLMCWHRINKQIEDMVSKSSACQENRNFQTKNHSYQLQYYEGHDNDWQKTYLPVLEVSGPYV